MKLKCLVKYLAPVLVMGAYAASASAQSLQCSEALFAYGDEFPIEKMGTKVAVEKMEIPQRTGGVITITSYTSDDNWISVKSCDACNPRESRDGTYITINEALPCGIKKGMTEQQVVQAVGEPDLKKDNGEFLIYDTSTKEIRRLSLHMLDGRLNGLMNEY